MENASKALVMAGGILIALLVIGALLLMVNQISDYQKSETSSTKTSQIINYNKEFERFTYSSIKGSDLITLVNKVVDNNKKSGVGNSINYEEDITLKILLGKDFASKFGVGNKLKVFSTNQYEIKDENNDFSKAISTFSTLENQYTLSVMSKLSANYDSLKKGEKTFEEVAGFKNNNISKDELMKQIEQYREYSDFKSATFESKDNLEYYPDGQIKSLSFKFIN